MSRVSIDEPQIYEEKEVNSGGRLYVGREHDGRTMTIVAEYANTAWEDLEEAISEQNAARVENIIDNLNASEGHNVARHFGVEVSDDAPVFLIRDKLSDELLERADAIAAEEEPTAD